MDLEKYSKQLEKWQNKRLSDTENSIRLFYRKLVRTVLNEVAALYEKYERDGELTYAEMMKYDRYKRFMDSLTLHVNTMSKTTRNSIDKLLSECYTYSYAWMGWAIQSSARKKLQYTALKIEQIRRAVDNPVTGLTLKQTMEKNRRDIIHRINQTVTQNLVKGVTYKDMAVSLTETFEGDYNKAIRVARTETHRVREQATLDSAQHANKRGVVMVKKWRNMKDSRVRKKSKANHVKMDNVKVPVDDHFDLGRGERTLAPGNSGYAHHDINCRCLLVYEIDRIEGQTNDDLARQTFEDFQRAMV